MLLLLFISFSLTKRGKLNAALSNTRARYFIHDRSVDERKRKKLERAKNGFYNKRNNPKTVKALRKKIKLKYLKRKTAEMERERKINKRIFHDSLGSVVKMEFDES